jgi:hypothetical protein
VKKKLIEVALPLEASNKAAAREKSVRHGRPSTLHEGTATPLSPPDLLSSSRRPATEIHEHATKPKSPDLLLPNQIPQRVVSVQQETSEKPAFPPVFPEVPVSAEYPRQDSNL